MLTQFNKIVLTVATVVLIIMLVLLGIFLSKSMFEDGYPPIITDCPDYWDISNNNGTKSCVDILKINSGKGTNYCNRIFTDLFDKQYSKDESICKKKEWAKDCKVSWDGITNNNKACENSIF